MKQYTNKIICLFIIFNIISLLTACSSAELNDAVDEKNGARDSYFYNIDNVISKKISQDYLEQISSKYKVLNEEKLSNVVYPLSLFNGNTMYQAVEIYKQHYFQRSQKNISTYDALQEIKKILLASDIDKLTSDKIANNYYDIEAKVFNQISNMTISLNGQWEITDQSDDEGVVKNDVLGESRYTINATDSIKIINETIRKYQQDQARLAMHMLLEKSYDGFLNNFYTQQNKIEVESVKNNHLKGVNDILNFTYKNKVEHDVDYYIDEYNKAIAQGVAHNKFVAEKKKEQEIKVAKAKKDKEEKLAQQEQDKGKRLENENKEIDRRNSEIEEQNKKIEQTNQRIQAYQAGGGRPIAINRIDINSVTLLVGARVFQVLPDGIFVANNDFQVFIRTVGTSYMQNQVFGYTLLQPDGPYTYPTTAGTYNTVPAFRVAPENNLFQSMRDLPLDKIIYLSTTPKIPKIEHKTMKDIENEYARENAGYNNADDVEQALPIGEIVSIELIKESPTPSFKQNVLTSYKTKIYQ